MSQIDRHKNRVVEIEFDPNVDLATLPFPERHSMIFVTQGHAEGTINDFPVQVSAPGVLCVRSGDVIKFHTVKNICASSFSFEPQFLNTIRVSQQQDINIPETPRIREGLSLFKNSSDHVGFIKLDEGIYSDFLEWFFTIGTETSAQSDDLWVCRIKMYLIKIFNLLKNLEKTRQKSPLDTAVKYIHTHYQDKVMQDDLTEITHLNRVSLNELFKKRFDKTAMQYLRDYRIYIAEQMLTNTGMTLNDIAISTGFEYDTYFMKQFKIKDGMSPSEYREVTRKVALKQ
ncbi:AraC family transcriptional regulator [Companilactobacillus sp.]|jgi:YesN/AraC family two-component response regulator|uniref:AraC family transcriptional regulator n=1 Tax=Companilactobacillus sp. TaxID=2767905 RepID=UPI0025BF5800|nr:helix-turn-helix domain-containing protein [Companilactobacillus sp.]MCH4009372.1 helix-turn-helix domain-containing protein [Companilactobacillus sp.]MCH4050449.1 helix-turn-helix domain-containing protein [Companilactobacillus sp.]MCH4077314.1 helix-turn-helix domain-containing protein [Companilactobacillus sp.]MCH4125890.1 helix-turn-helix domain-containing protein [Companilactobacillus sp.]MCI1311599.1 helix-turn-helix domain-containing protein [Companilactobacillus sp.]